MKGRPCKNMYLVDEEEETWEFLPVRLWTDFIEVARLLDRLPIFFISNELIKFQDGSVLTREIYERILHRRTDWRDIQTPNTILRHCCGTRQQFTTILNWVCEESVGFFSIP
jgi:hypothetical protein